MPKALEPIENRLQLGTTDHLKLDKLSRWVHGIGLGGTGLVLLIFIIIFAIFKYIPVWADWVLADEFINPAYGEHIYLESILRTRMNI